MDHDQLTDYSIILKGMILSQRGEIFALQNFIDALIIKMGVDQPNFVEDISGIMESKTMQLYESLPDEVVGGFRTVMERLMGNLKTIQAG